MAQISGRDLGFSILEGNTMRLSLRVILIVIVLIVTVNSYGQSLTGAFSIVWDDAKVLDASLAKDHGSIVSVSPSRGVPMQCIRAGNEITCDYVDESTGKFKNRPSVFQIEFEKDGYIFASNKSNTTRLHINTRDSTAVLKSNISFMDNPDYFGVKMCSGRIIR